MSKLVEDSAVENPAENLEVILLKKICPQCGNNDVLTAKIGFSQKNKKPYYRVKCAKKGCAFLSWVDVKEYKGEEL